MKKKKEYIPVEITIIKVEDVIVTSGFSVSEKAYAGDKLTWEELLGDDAG